MISNQAETTPQDQDSILQTFPIYITNGMESNGGTESHAALSLLQFPLGMTGSLPLKAKVKSTDISTSTTAAAFQPNAPMNSSSSLHGPSTNQNTFAKAKKMLEMDVNVVGMPRKEHGMLEDGQDPNQQIPLESFCVPNNARYMVGTFNNGTLYLSPIDILQMRPKLSFIDKRVEKEREGKVKQGYEDQKELNPDYEAEAKTVQVSFRAADDKEGMKKASLVETQRMIEQEPWKELDVYGPSSSVSRSYWSKLHHKEKGSHANSKASLSVKPASEYLDLISSYNPTRTSHERDHMNGSRMITPLSAQSTQSSIPESLFSTTASQIGGNGHQSLPAFFESIKLGLPLQDRVASLLLSSHAISFTKLVTLFTRIDVENEHDARILTTELSPLLSILTEISNCIDGIFYISSSMLYRGHPMHARNVLLGYLMQNKSVSRLDWSNECRMNATMSGNMLKEICVFDEFTRKWSGKIEPDPLLLQWFPAIQQKHHKTISVLFQNSLSQIKQDGVESKKQQQQAGIHAEPLPLPIPLSPIKNGKKQHAVASMLVHHELEGDGEKEQVKNLIKRILETNGALLKSQVHEIVRYQASQAPQVQTMIDNVCAATLESMIISSSFEIRDDIVAPKPDLETPLGRFKNATWNYFKNHDKVKKSEMMEVWDSECGGKPSAAMYSKIMSEVATTKSSGIWRLKWLCE